MKTFQIALLLALTILSAGAAIADLSDGVIRYWTFDNADTSGSDAIDSTAAEVATINGATTGATGKINQAYDFDGSNDFVDLNYRPANIDNGFTTCLWIDGDDATIASRQDYLGETGVNSDWRISVQTDTQAQGFARDNTATHQVTLEGTSIVAGNGWHYGCIAYNPTGNNIVLYIDGSAQDTDSITLAGEFAPLWDIYVGARNDGGSAANFFDGTIDEVGIWNRSLNSTEISLLWNGGNGNPYSNWSGSPPSSNKFVITGFDDETTSPINTFNVNVTLANSSTYQYSTTNGTVITDIEKSDSVLSNLSGYASGYAPLTIINHNVTNDLGINFTPFWQIRAYDLYTGNALSTFNASVTYAGTTTQHTTTNGVINTTAPLQAGTANVTITAHNYFSKTLLSQSTATDLNESLFQAQVTFTGKEIASNATVTSFNVTAPNGQNSSANPPTLYLAAGTYNITYTSTNYHSFTEEITVTALTNTTYNTSNFFRFYLAVRARSGVNGTYDNSFTIIANSTAYTYETSVQTTNGTAIIKWNNETNLNLTLVNSSFLATTSINWNTNNVTAPAIINITITGYTTNSFFLTFYNETTNERLTTNVTVLVISDIFAANYTTGTDASLNVTFLTPSDYEIRYWYDADVPRSYYVTLTNQSTQTLRLYTIDESIRALYIPVVTNQYGYACSDQTVSLLRYFVASNSYAIVEMSKTDTNGNAVLNVQPNIINYKLQFSGNCGNFTTQPQKITGSTNSFTVNNAQSPLVVVAAYDTVSRSLTYTNSTQTIVFNWADTANIVTQACLRVTKLDGGVISTAYNACATTPSGSLIYTINDTNQTTYKATSTITINGGYAFSDTLEVNFQTGFQSWGITGLFFTAIIVVLFATMGTGTPETTVMLGTLAVALMGVFSIIAWNWTYFVGMFIVAGIILYKVGR